jgi:hypothetical protein
MIKTRRKVSYRNSPAQLDPVSGRGNDLSQAGLLRCKIYF